MLKTAIKAAKAAGKIIKENFEKSMDVYTYKDVHSVVTQTDLQAEKAILGILSAKYPAHSFLSEEAGMIEKSSDYLWVIDPLDGTTNFSRHIPHFCVSIALFHKEKPILGVIYQPMTKELFSARQGRGAFLNGKAIRTKKQENPDKALAGVSRGGNAEGKIKFISTIARLTDTVRSMRVLGSSALDLCFLACGRLDAVVSNEISFHDYAAGMIIAKEAGAAMSDFEGNDWTFTKAKSDIIVADFIIRDKLVKSLHHV